MSLPKEFWEKLPEKSDAQLYEMLVHKDDYLPEALEADREELQKRNLAPEREQELEAFAQVQKAGEDTKTNEPLNWPIRILICTVCPVIVGAILGSYYHNKGYERKANECWMLTVISILFWAGLVYALRNIVR